jgi:hypothetical protein
MTDILPFDRITTTTITRFEIENIDLQLFSSARIRVNLYNSSGQRIEVANVMISGADYFTWGNDDQYVITYVANALGFQIPEPEVVVVEPEVVVVEPEVVVVEPEVVVVEPEVV